MLTAEGTADVHERQRPATRSGPGYREWVVGSRKPTGPLEPGCNATVMNTCMHRVRNRWLGSQSRNVLNAGKFQ